MADELLLFRVVQQCRDLADALGIGVAIEPIVGSTLFQMISSVNPETGTVMSEPRRILPKAKELHEVSKQLNVWIASTNMRNRIITDIHEKGQST